MSEIDKLPPWIDSLGKALGVIASASLGISIVYDWGFYHALNLSFLEIPTSLTDHIRSSLMWVPLVASTAFLALILELLLGSKEPVTIEKEVIGSSSDPVRTRKIRLIILRLLTILSFTILFCYLLFGHIFFRGVPIALMIVWFEISFWAKRQSTFLKRKPPVILFVIHWLPPFIIWMGFAGFDQAIVLIKEESPRHIVYLSETPEKIHKINILRTLERGIIAKIPGSKNTLFLAWPAIGKIQTSYENEPFRGILFNWFNFHLPKFNGKIQSKENSSPKR